MLGGLLDKIGYTPKRTEKRPIDRYHDGEITVQEYIKAIKSRPLHKTERMAQSEKRMRQIAERHNLE